MKIPDNLRHFEKRTLFVVMQHRRAKAFEVLDDLVTDKGVIETDDTEFEYTDRKTLSADSGTGRVSGAGSEKHNKEHYDHVYMNYFSKEFSKLANGYPAVVIFVPKDIKSLLHDKLNQQELEKTKFIYGNYYNNHLHELLEMALKA